ASLVGLAGAMFLLTLLVVYPGSEVVDFPLEVIGFGPQYYLLVFSAFFVVCIPLVAIFSSVVSALRRKAVMGGAAALSLVFLWMICGSIAVATTLHVLPDVRAALEGTQDGPIANIGDMERIEKQMLFESTDD